MSDYSPRYLLTDDDYNACGAVYRDNDGRWIGHDTSGRRLFSRATHDRIEAAAKRIGVRLVSGAHYGLDRADADHPAPAVVRDRDRKREAYVSPWSTA